MGIREELQQDQPMTTEIHKLGSRLWRQIQSDGTKIVLMSSALRGEGKSTTVAYLASALALHPGRRIVAVDMDFRSPSLNRYFHVEVSRGLGDALRGECPVTETVVPSGIRVNGSGLDLVLPGPDDDDPQLLLNTPKLVEAFRLLRSSYDLVLVDAPAIVPVPDATVILPLCDAVILAVMAGVSTKHHLQRARELCLGLGANILGIVVGNAQQAAPEYMDTHYYGYSRERAKKKAASPREGV